MSHPASHVIPAPVECRDDGGSFTLHAAARIEAPDDARSIGTYLAEVLRAATGFALPVVNRGPSAGAGDAVECRRGDICLVLTSGIPKGGYELTIEEGGILISASEPEGLFAGVQTLRQLFPPAPRAHWSLATTTISDHPRFGYRGAMLDVARHFFGVDDVKRYIDAIALLKFTVLHLHLTDDQGWRLEIDGWPKLTEHGGSTQVGGGGGGFYTQAEFSEIVNYARSRFITIVPEIDLPGHTNAALASYPELTCDGHAPDLYEGIEVGFSSLCINSERSYEFVADVLGQVAALTLGPWIHIGGDEALATPEADYLKFIERASRIAADTGKTVIGWHEMGRCGALPPGTIGEYWNLTRPEKDAGDLARRFVDGGGQLIMAPGDVAYLDMKYEESSPLGLVWANGPTSLEDALGWDPADIVPGIGDADILGVEAPLWTETIGTLDELMAMAFPRIAAIAEIAWSPRRERDFAEFAGRLATLGTHLDALGIAYHRTPNVPWRMADAAYRSARIRGSASVLR